MTLFCALAALCGSTFAVAGQFSVSPVRIFMAPQDRAVAVTVINEGDDELVMQAEVNTWRQKPGGEDELTPSEDLFLSPPIIKLAPKARQVVRLAMVKAPKSGPQLTYRLVIREVPEVKPAEKRLQVQIALAFSLPVFITPPGAERKVSCMATRAKADEARVTCTNSGTAYAQIRDLALNATDGKKIVSRDIGGGYLLQGISRDFELRVADGKLPSGKAKLVATFDDNATQSFDVSLAD